MTASTGGWSHPRQRTRFDADLLHPSHVDVVAATCRAEASRIEQDRDEIEVSLLVEGVLTEQPQGVPHHPVDVPASHSRAIKALSRVA